MELFPEVPRTVEVCVFDEIVDGKEAALNNAVERISCPPRP